ncbi:cobaltochelatase CobT-related protein [Rhodoferax sediminis]|uniref:Cobalt chelatase n=1 Tax=Rhodoferax sediminis TaxID=2509614 RepID=A0A515DDF5_9BURK|nr:cobalt chelatase [Rhodoferax sediminis]QDL38458.1 cobalt chelatase [Rhodoferax sediminis]
MSETQARVRHQQRVEELCAATIRALSGEADLHFRARRLHRGRRALPLFAPHLHPSLDTDDFGSFRGAADGLALRLSKSDAALHRSLCPSDPVERLVFDLLEQIRVEALAPADMPGVAHNLRHRFEAWSLAFHHSGLTDSARGILLYTVAQICRSRVTGERVLDATEDLMEATRGALGPLLGHDLAGLRRTRTTQGAYAVHALGIARAVGEMLRSASDEGAVPFADDDDDNVRTAFSLVMDTDSELTEGVETAVSGRSRVLEAADDGYRVFTTAYDRECLAATLVRPELLKDFRARLDARIAGQGINIARLARELRALLAVPARDGWDGDQDEGYIDGRRLALLVASPTERRLFRTEHIEPTANCVLSFLIDCSGSMRAHIESVAMFIDVFVRALEQAGVATEVLGFTTGAWNGGLAQRDWVRAGRPQHPGRLNEVCHVVFKDAETRWQRARPAIAALLKGDLFREGIDGEAVAWACRRLAGRGEDRKLLLVISDGSPMDSATNLANDAHYLDHHLRDVVQSVESTRQIEILGVGVGLDLSPYYSRSHVLDLAGSTGNQVFRELIDLIAGHGRR